MKITVARSETIWTFKQDDSILYQGFPEGIYLPGTSRHVMIDAQKIQVAELYHKNFSKLTILINEGNDEIKVGKHSPFFKSHYSYRYKADTYKIYPHSGLPKHSIFKNGKQIGKSLHEKTLVKSKAKFDLFINANEDNLVLFVG